MKPLAQVQREEATGYVEEGKSLCVEEEANGRVRGILAEKTSWKISRDMSSIGMRDGFQVNATAKRVRTGPFARAQCLSPYYTIKRPCPLRITRADNAHETIVSLGRSSKRTNNRR
jgi:hypothetical protein